MTNEPDQIETATLLHFPDIITPVSLAEALEDIRKYFAADNLPQPPRPNINAAILPCTVLVTSKEEESGEDIGRIQFIRPDGTVFFDEKWVISQSS